jgi:hypothetical protein
LSSRLNSTGCVKTRAKPKPVQNLSTFKRQNSIESTRRSKKGISVIPRLSESNSLLSESPDLENSCSYESCRSVDEDVYLDSLPASPKLCESLRQSDTNIPVLRTPPVLISIDELESQKGKLRTPRKRSGSISVKKVRTRKSWIRPEAEIVDPDVSLFNNLKLHKDSTCFYCSMCVIFASCFHNFHEKLTSSITSRVKSPYLQVEKVKCALTDEVLIIEDLISGHQDIIQKLASRTLVTLNATLLNNYFTALQESSPVCWVILPARWTSTRLRVLRSLSCFQAPLIITGKLKD